MRRCYLHALGLLGVLVALLVALDGASPSARAVTPSAAPTSTVAPGPILIGGLDVAAYCQSTTGGSSALAKGAISGPGFAYRNWTCSGSSTPLSIQQLCRWTYGATHPRVIAIATDPNNAFSWRCYSARALASAPTGPSIVAPIASTIGTPRQIFHSWRHNLLNVLITIAVMPFITFPAIILNDTLSENYDEILVMLALARRRARHPWRSRTTLTKPTELNVSDTARGQPHRDPRDARARRWWFAVTLVAGAVLGGMLNPKFGINQQSVLGVIATLVAFIVGAALSWFVATKYRTRHSLSTEAFLRGLPAGLGVAALCVAISRLSDFQPGYLYGVVAGVAYVESMTRRATAHLVTLTTLSTLAVAAGAWMAWIPVNHLALQRGANVLVVLTDDLLGSLFIGGLVGTVVGLLPLEFMPGGSVAKWRKDVWAAVFFFAVFLLISVELNPASGPTHPGRAPVVTALVLFVLFATLSFGTRSYFARRHAHGSESVADKIG